MSKEQLAIRDVQPDDLDALLELENRAFATDRLSRRSMRHWIKNEGCDFLVALLADQLVGYILIIYHRGTRLARMYSIAVDESQRGKGIARKLITAGEQHASEGGHFFLRLEVGAENHAAIRLYESLGYQSFGIYHDYYEDHTDAIRMQKRIRRFKATAQHTGMTWIRQTTPFTCGPAALMMAMQALSDSYIPSQEEEIRLWREATTIFMTSGHGGCHPVGLALAARARGFDVEVWLNKKGPLFVDSVRDANKKRVIELVHQDYVQAARQRQIPLHPTSVTQVELVRALDAGKIPLILISTFRMDGKKSPHWVAVSGYDEDCLYVHDPDPSEGSQSALDCQYLPIAREDFDKISLFGQSRLRTCVIVSAPH